MVWPELADEGGEASVGVRSGSAKAAPAVAAIVVSKKAAAQTKRRLNGC